MICKAIRRHLESLAHHGNALKDLRGSDRDAAFTRAALARFLEETAPDNYRARRWGSLWRVRTPDNTNRWLCEDCAKRSR